MTTKEKILEVSLTLFSQRGYSGVSVRDIAREVGVRESALYKHYQNKQDILDHIVLHMQERIHEVYVTSEVPETVSDDIAAGYRALNSQSLFAMSWHLFEFFTKEADVCAYRKLLMREQYNNDYISKLYNDTFLEGALLKQSQTFQALISSGFFRKADANIAALHFYGPILLLFQEYDCDPGREAEIKECLRKHVETFGRNYASSHEGEK